MPSSGNNKCSCANPNAKDDNVEPKSQVASCGCSKCGRTSTKRPPPGPPLPDDINKSLLTSEKVQIKEEERHLLGACMPSHVPGSNIHKVIPEKLYNWGEQGCGFKSRGPPQDYFALKTELLKSKTLFEDIEFPAVTTPALYNTIQNEWFKDEIKWLRPGEIVSNPQMFVDGFSRFDVMQGAVGSCFVLAAMASLSSSHKDFIEVVPLNQTFDQDYAGIFHFRLWHFGRWIDVVIDDKLPTARKQLIFATSSNKNEFWSALLEKAFAKVLGGYHVLDAGGDYSAAMQVLTGGLCEAKVTLMNIEYDDLHIFEEMLFEFQKKGSFMGCFRPGAEEMGLPPGREIEGKTPEGIVTNHQYSITGLVKIKYMGKNLTLIRIRNPWGNQVEWNGPWSDKSAEWNSVSPEEKKLIGLVVQDDGEFFMSLKDFITHFYFMDTCHIREESASDIELGRKLKWELESFEGEWIRGVSAGGDSSDPQWFWTNPQFTMVVDGKRDEEYKVVIQVLLNDRFLLYPQEFYSAFILYKINNPMVPSPITYEFLASPQMKPDMIAGVETVKCTEGHPTERLSLKPGTYVIIPYLPEPLMTGHFLLRIMSEVPTHLQERDKPPEKKEPRKEEKPRNIEDIKKEAEKLFLATVGKDNALSWMKLRDIMNKSFKSMLNGRTISKSICQSMMATMDFDYSGKLDVNEFERLWCMIQTWKNFFNAEAINGAVTGLQLRGILAKMNIHISSRILNLCVHRYGNRNSEFEFDDYILITIRLYQLMEKFGKISGGKEFATLILDQWLFLTLYT